MDEKLENFHLRWSDNRKLSFTINPNDSCQAYVKTRQELGECRFKIIQDHIWSTLYYFVTREFSHTGTKITLYPDLSWPTSMQWIDAETGKQKRKISHPRVHWHGIIEIENPQYLPELLLKCHFITKRVGRIELDTLEEDSEDWQNYCTKFVRTFPAYERYIIRINMDDIILSKRDKRRTKRVNTGRSTPEEEATGDSPEEGREIPYEAERSKGVPPDRG